MSKRCSVCHHEIDRALCTGLSKRAIAEKYELHPDSVWRHGRNHLSPEMRAAIGLRLLKREDSVRSALLAEGENVAQSLAATRGVLFSRFLVAADVGDDRAVSALAGRILESLSLTARVTGELFPAGGVNITNLVVSADYVRLRSELLAALRPFPEAARAVADVFRRTGERAAGEMQRSIPRVIDATATEMTDAAA